MSMLQRNAEDQFHN